MKNNKMEGNFENSNHEKGNNSVLEGRNSSLIELIITLDPIVGAAVNTGLCPAEVATIIIKEFIDPKEYREIFAEINKNNLQINENSWKLFSLSHKKIEPRAFNPNIYIKCLLERAIKNENNEIDNKFYKSLSDFVNLLEMSPQREEKEGLRAIIISKFLKGFFTKNDYLEFKRNKIDMDVLYALYKPLDEEGLNFLKDIANLGFVGHSQYLCFRAYSQKGVTVEQCKEIKNKYEYFGDKEFEKEFGEEFGES